MQNNIINTSEKNTLRKKPQNTRQKIKVRPRFTIIYAVCVALIILYKSIIRPQLHNTNYKA